MNIIKEYCPYAKIAVIRTNGYGSQLDKFHLFYQEALKDFPNLSLSDIRVVKYGGSYYAKTFGIEFPANHKADGYSEISELEVES